MIKTHLNRPFAWFLILPLFEAGICSAQIPACISESVKQITDGRALSHERAGYTEFATAFRKHFVSPEDFFERVVQPKNRIGVGGEGTVYSIPSVPDFVVKVRHSQKPPFSGNLEKVVDLLPDENIGQAVATIGLVKILRKQEGIPVGALAIRPTDTLRSAAAMPQESYDRFVLLIERLRKTGFYPDLDNVQNLLIDVGRKRFNLVDVKPPPNRRPFEEDGAGSLMYMLNDNLQTGNSWANATELDPARHEIIRKCLEAVRRTGVPFDPHNWHVRTIFINSRMPISPVEALRVR